MEMKHIILFFIIITTASCAATTRTISLKTENYKQYVDIYSSTDQKTVNNKIAFILLHGKSGTGREHTGTSGLAAELSDSGYTVYVPDMPYSPYTATLNVAFKHIDGLVKKAALENKKVILVGHSIGAAIAFLYCSAYQCSPDMAGIVMAAPGHMLQLSTKIQEATALNVQRARKLAKQGKGNIKTTFVDMNQGRKLNVDTSPDIYLSYFDPAQFPNPATHLDILKVPVLWIDGVDDAAAARMGYENLFDRIHKYTNYKQNKYIEVSGGHISMMDYIAEPILTWTKLFE